VEVTFERAVTADKVRRLLTFRSLADTF